MIVHATVLSVLILLPQCPLALVLLAPPGSHIDTSKDMSIWDVELDDSIGNQSSLMPESNLERSHFPLEWDDITLQKDILKNHHRRHRHRHDHPQRHHDAAPRKESETVTSYYSSDNGGEAHIRRKRSAVSRTEPFSIGSGLDNSVQDSDIVATSESLFKRIVDEAMAIVTSRQPDTRPLHRHHRQHHHHHHHHHQHNHKNGPAGLSSPSSSLSSLSMSSSSQTETSGNSSSPSEGSNTQANPLIYKNGGPLSQGIDVTSPLSSTASGYSLNDSRKSREKRWAPRLQRVKLSRLISMSSALGQPIILRKRNRIEAKVGVLVVVENSIYRQYLLDNGNNPRAALARIRRYYGMVFSMMNQRFETIKDPYLSITVKISGILVAESRDDSNWLEHIVEWESVAIHGRGSVQTDKALRKFTKWVSGRTDLPKYDHAMAFTAYRLTNRQGVGLGGMAYLNAICDTSSGNAVSIVADRGDFQCVKVATHELAHSLGASHDGDRQSKTCRPDSNFIMSPLTSHDNHVLRNAFFFSPCSIRDMSYHLAKPSSSCVMDEPTEYYSYDLGRLPPGRLYSADMQCKLVFGKKSEFCREGNLVNIMCGQLWCRDPDKNNGCRTNSYLTALPGTECGHNKVCHLGECVVDTSRNFIQRTPLTSSINIIPSIPQPDRPSFRMRRPRRRDSSRRYKLRLRSGKRARRRRRRNRCTEDKNPKYCEGLIRLNPGGCKRRAIRQYCCLTCRRLRRRRRR